LKVGSTSFEEISCGFVVCARKVQGVKTGITVRMTAHSREGNRGLGRRARVSEGNINPGPVYSNAGTLPLTAHDIHRMQVDAHRVTDLVSGSQVPKSS
jgi:hypothetical protein